VSRGNVQVGVEENNLRLGDGSLTLAFKELGFRVGVVGKWGLGKEEGAPWH
jgi:hypothetical protein